MLTPDLEVAIFNHALQLPPEQRASYIHRECAGNDLLERKVGALLRVHDEVGTFLEESPHPAVPQSGASRPEAALGGATCAMEQAGDRIGQYKLLQQIGEGGCGVVYLAEQEEPVRRRVALKVIKLGMDTRHVIARFEAERQALALMDHPNIAKVLDAGATDAGRPFFVMELVPGNPLTEYCDQNRLATEERLKLFTQVCQAIQHAHQKGIIHRDIKPSNILVANHDGMPVPKVIDFGIAKATTDQRLTDKTLFTAFEQFMGTPAYMSPEQSMLNGLDIDTRTDVYSLGVLLYELLTGKTPFDSKALLGSGLEEMRRAIREREPARPSTRLTTMLAADLIIVARQRRSEPPKLVHLVRGDLDWIVMKALEKERSRRYETANGLAMDVQRYLANDPVAARPPSNLYRFQKMVRRNKGAFAAAMGITGALLAGLVASTYLLLIESKAKRFALAAEQRAQRGELAARGAEQRTTAALWESYLAQAKASCVSDQPGRRSAGLEALAKAAAIRFAPELRDEAIACLALPDFKLRRRIEVHRGVFDNTLERYAMVSTNLDDICVRRTSDDHELVRLPNTAGTVKWLGRFSRDGKLLPVWCLDRSLRVWDLERRAIILTVPCSPTGDMDFAPDGRRVAVVSGQAEVSIYDLAAGNKVFSFPGPFVPRWVRYSPDGGRLAIASPSTNRLAVLDAGTGTSLLSLTNKNGFTQVSWHPREPVLAGAGADNLILMWDTLDGRLLRTLKAHEQPPGDLAFSRDGELLFSAGWGGTCLWCTRTGELLLRAPVAAALFDTAPDGASFGYARYDLSRSLEDTPAGLEAIEVMSLNFGGEATPWRAKEEDKNHKVAAFSPDGTWLAFGVGEVVELYDARTRELLATLPTGPALGVCFQKSGQGLWVSGEQGLFHWPVQTASGPGVTVSVGPPQPIGPPGAWQQASLSENGQVFAAFHGNHVRTFEAETLRESARTGFCGDEDEFHYLALSADGFWLATGGWQRTEVKVWSVRTGGLIKELADPAWLPVGSPWPFFERDGPSLLISSRDSYRLWETNSWTPGPRLPRANWGMMTLSHRSGMVAIGQGGTAIELRDQASGQVLAVLQAPSRSTVTELAFSPDDTQLAVAHNVTRELVVWDLRLLREELRQMGMDWERPPYPARSEKDLPARFHLRVLTNTVSMSLPSR